MTTLTNETSDQRDEPVVSVRFTVDRELVELLRDLPAHTRMWDRGERCWFVRPEVLRTPITRVRPAGHEVLHLRPPPPAARTRSSSASWADVVFDAVGPDRVEPVFRALLKVLRPGVGGTDELSRKLTDAKDKYALAARRATT